MAVKITGVRNGRTIPMVVRPHAPWRLPVWAILLVLVAVTSGWLLFEYGRASAGYDQKAVAAEQQKARAALDELHQQSIVLRERIAVLERSGQVDQQAYTTVKDELKQLQDEIGELKAELEFYRGIVTPADGVSGLRIQAVKLTGKGRRQWRYSLVLTQVLQNAAIVQGQVSLALEGLQSGAPRKLALSDLSRDSGGSLRFRFKYYQNLEGELQLPEGFEPRTVLIDVTPSTGGYKNFSHSVAWPSAAAGPRSGPDPS